MQTSAPEEIKLRIQELKSEHQDLDDVIARLGSDVHVDDLRLRRLKKRKLQLKDAITRLESDLLPDIIA